MFEVKILVSSSDDDTSYLIVHMLGHHQMMTCTYHRVYKNNEPSGPIWWVLGVVHRGIDNRYLPKFEKWGFLKIWGRKCQNRHFCPPSRAQPRKLLCGSGFIPRSDFLKIGHSPLHKTSGVLLINVFFGWNFPKSRKITIFTKIQLPKLKKIDDF